MPRIRATFHLSPDTLDDLRDAAAALAGPPYHRTVGEIVNDALEAHLKRLRAEHNGGSAFPKRRSPLKGGRPIRFRRPLAVQTVTRSER